MAEFMRCTTLIFLLIIASNVSGADEYDIIKVLDVKTFFAFKVPLSLDSIDKLDKFIESNSKEIQDYKNELINSKDYKNRIFFAKNNQDVEFKDLQTYIFNKQDVVYKGYKHDKSEIISIYKNGDKPVKKWRVVALFPASCDCYELFVYFENMSKNLTYTEVIVINEATNEFLQSSYNKQYKHFINLVTSSSEFKKLMNTSWWEPNENMPVIFSINKRGNGVMGANSFRGLDILFSE